MPKTASINRKRAAAHTREAGLSLVEVLVALSITALASVMIVATARPADALKSEHDKLAATLHRLDSRAKVSGEATGLLVDPKSYAPAKWADGEWLASASGRHIMPGQITLRVETYDATGPQVLFDPLMPEALPKIVISDGRRELVLDYPSKARN